VGDSEEKPNGRYGRQAAQSRSPFRGCVLSLTRTWELVLAIVTTLSLVIGAFAAGRQAGQGGPEGIRGGSKTSNAPPQYERMMNSVKRNTLEAQRASIAGDHPWEGE